MMILFEKKMLDFLAILLINQIFLNLHTTSSVLFRIATFEQFC